MKNSATNQSRQFQIAGNSLIKHGFSDLDNSRTNSGQFRLNQGTAISGSSPID